MSAVGLKKIIGIFMTFALIYTVRCEPVQIDYQLEVSKQWYKNNDCPSNGLFYTRCYICRPKEGPEKIVSCRINIVTLIEFQEKGKFIECGSESNIKEKCTYCTCDKTKNNFACHDRDCNTYPNADGIVDPTISES